MRRLADFLVIGDREILEKAGRRIGVSFRPRVLDLDNVYIKGFSYGKQSGAYGRAAMEYLDAAVGLMLDGGAGCLVTAPVNKASIRAAGFAGFLGHTEYLAGRTGAKDYAMMFVGRRLKVTLVTRHIALGRVPASLSAGSISRVIRLTHDSLRRYFGIRRPRIAVAGLNPHAGERGAFGIEEKRVIAPAVKRASSRLGGVSGPFPPDAIFHDALAGKYDAVVAMYHDQGLIPFKLLYFMDGVNMTLGLPFVRTSPDHGTAFEIAGKGVADPSSMIAALKLACRLRERARG
jgi:4-hydroxythreonine-4-phosphate dehydrogenase